MANRKSTMHLPNSSASGFDTHHFETEVDQIADMTDYMKELNKTVKNENELCDILSENIEANSEDLEISKNTIVNALRNEPPTLETIKTNIINTFTTNKEIKDYIKNEIPENTTATQVQCKNCSQCTYTQCKDCTYYNCNYRECSYSCSCSCSCGSCGS